MAVVTHECVSYIFWHAPTCYCQLPCIALGQILDLLMGLIYSDHTFGSHFETPVSEVVLIFGIHLTAQPQRTRVHTVEQHTTVVILTFWCRCLIFGKDGRFCPTAAPTPSVRTAILAAIWQGLNRPHSSIKFISPFYQVMPKAIPLNVDGLEYVRCLVLARNPLSTIMLPRRPTLSMVSTTKTCSLPRKD